MEFSRSRKLRFLGRWIKLLDHVARTTENDRRKARPNKAEPAKRHQWKITTVFLIIWKIKSDNTSSYLQQCVHFWKAWWRDGSISGFPEYVSTNHIQISGLWTHLNQFIYVSAVCKAFLFRNMGIHRLAHMGMRKEEEFSTSGARALLLSGVIVLFRRKKKGSIQLYNSQNSQKNICGSKKNPPKHTHLKPKILITICGSKKNHTLFIWYIDIYRRNLT